MSSSKPNSASWKGKDKAIPTGYDDLDPVITYRHLLSHNLGVKDPLRVVALCDSDAFYAACEQARLGIDPSKPLVVQQWDALIAVNYPARKYGITRMEKIKEARRKCPGLTVVHVATYKEGEKEPGYWENPDTLTHKVSLDLYRRESMKILRMFQEGLPNGEIEKASIDEAFIDFTHPVRDEILRRYPHLVQVPSDAPYGLDSPLPPPPSISWDGLGTVISVDPAAPEASASEVAEQSSSTVPSISSDSTHNEEHATTWHDIALSIAAELMGRIRHDIHVKLGYTTSAGIARNKFLAKLTASFKKPNNQSILRNAAIPIYLRPMAFQKIRFLGGKLGKAIAEEYDVSTVGDLLICLAEMQRKFGEESIWVYEILRGIDRSEVKEKSTVNKSMMASKNLPQPITKATQGHHWIRVLAAELALRLNEARIDIPALWPKTLVLHVRLGYETSRSKQSPFPFSRKVTVDLVASAGDKLWKELVGTESTRASPMKITHVALGFSGVEKMETGQKSIEGFLHSRTDSDDTPRGNGASHKRKRESELSKEVTAADDKEAQTVDSPRARHSASTSFVCGRCRKRIALPDDMAGDALDAELRIEALAALQSEHADFHLAQDLAKQFSDDQPTRAIRPDDKSQPKKRKKQGRQDGGIAKFFGGK